jgi:hypothetical protein
MPPPAPPPKKKLKKHLINVNVHRDIESGGERIILQLLCLQPFPTKKIKIQKIKN